MRMVLSIALAAMALVATATQFPAFAEDPVSVGELRIMHPWARASAGHGKAGAAFMTIANTGGADDKLISAATANAKKTEIHETKMEDGIMKMRMVMGGLTIPAGGKVELKPMGLHVMLMGVTEKLIEGETLMLTLTFEKAGSVELSVPIAGPGAMMAPNMN
ncbi:MAG: copper chaperone PCu(A)C [Alphaproteobacteria bacterium]|nr:copper chaperone PCu(A)C [Alphaproteobacteria bacterium]